MDLFLEKDFVLFLSLRMISSVEIVEHYTIFFEQALIGKTEIAVIPDNDVIQHLELHHIYCRITPPTGI